MEGELQGFPAPENGEPDESVPSGKASQRRRHLGGHSKEEEESREEEGRHFPGRGDSVHKG